MTYLTHAQLRHDTPQARDHARISLEDAHLDAGHSLIWSLFSDDPEAKRDFIYRASGSHSFLIVSAREPRNNSLVWNIKTKPYQLKLAKGERYGFSLRVNPVISLSQPDRKRSLRVDVLMHAKKKKSEKLDPQEREDVILSWLENKLKGKGAIIDKGACLVTEYSQKQLSRKNNQKKMTMSVVGVEGALTVNDPIELQKALNEGIGRGKAFGLGLLLLRPLNDGHEED